MQWAGPSGRVRPVLVGQQGGSGRRSAGGRTLRSQGVEQRGRSLITRKYQSAGTPGTAHMAQWGSGALCVSPTGCGSLLRGQLQLQLQPTSSLRGHMESEFPPPPLTARAAQYRREESVYSHSVCMLCRGAGGHWVRVSPVGGASCSSSSSSSCAPLRGGERERPE